MILRGNLIALVPMAGTYCLLSERQGSKDVLDEAWISRLWYLGTLLLQPLLYRLEQGLAASFSASAL